MSSTENGKLSNDHLTYTYNGVAYNSNIYGTNANWNLDPGEKNKLFKAIIENGGPLTDAQLQSLGLVNKNTTDSARFKNVRAAMELFVNQNSKLLGFDSNGIKYDSNGKVIEATPKEEAFNKYYDDWNNYEDPNSQGGKVLNRLEESYENKASTDLMLAEATMQQQALQQAQTVKAITDQVRAERMARLKAGMSESQIANQDMQMMMANVNALNQNAAMANQAKLGAQANQMMAKDLAFADYLGQSLQGSQVGAAYSAADAGNPSMQVQEYMRNNPNVSYSQAWQIVTGQNLNK